MYLFAQLQLQQLMDTLNLTEPHYIRCVKPNSLLKPFIFEHMNVIQQLRSGVSEIENQVLPYFLRVELLKLPLPVTIFASY